MEVLIIYLIFCLTTSIMASIFILRPALTMVGIVEPLNPVIEYTWLTYIVFFCLSMLTAPALFMSVIIPSFGDRFKNTLAKSLETSL